MIAKSTVLLATIDCAMDEDSSPPPSIDFSFDMDDSLNDPTFEVGDEEPSKNCQKEFDNKKVQQWVDELETEYEGMNKESTKTATPYVSSPSHTSPGQESQNVSQSVGNFAPGTSNVTDNKIEHTEAVDKPRFVHRAKKKKTICKFCKLEVSNFERHLERNHEEYKEVRDMLSFPKKSSERRNIITLIRNSANFNEYLIGNTIPKYKKNKKMDTEYYPCAYCKGLYSKRYLARHAKSCVVKDVTRDTKRFQHLSASQTLVACSLQRNNILQKLRVRDEVFKIMKADDISLVVKKDTLICHFGEQYLKKHKRAQMATVCSNKMRELARLLIEVRKATNDNNLTLEGVIHPKMFDIVIECAKRIGGYNANEKTFRAPSLSAHIGTSLKQVGDILLHLILKQDTSIKCDYSEERIKGVKRFRDLVMSQWTTEISSLAFKDLREKKWNKPVILPLTKDIIKFKKYVSEVANKALVALRENPNDKAQFKNLVNAALVLTILYNRRRIGDVQYTKIDTYLQNFTAVNQEECMNALSDSEKMLTKQYKRIITGGKGNRAVAILLPKQLQEYIEAMIDIRNSSNIVPQTNQYLFGYPDTEHWARADVAIRKFSEKADLKYPNEIRSNKLRKQIATVMQILNLDEEESAQFAQFLGHTEKTHNEFYKLPQDVYQTAKISKLLILMDKGLGDKYKGKSLNEIDIDPEQDYAETESDTEEDALPVSIETNKLPNTSVSSTGKGTLCNGTGLVFSQSLNDLDSDDNLKKIQEHLPPELQNFNTSSLPKFEQVEKVLREKCQKVSGTDSAVDLLKTEQETAKECMEKYVNASVVQEELEKAKNTGSMDEVFGKYCKRWPEIQACFENATSFARQCMDNKEQNAFNRSLTILQELQEFVCFKDGDRLAMFVAEGGIECMEEQKQGVQDCLNKTLGARLPESDELSITNIPTFLFSAKECEDFDAVRTCINAELEKCKDSTPANIVDAFFKFLKKQMPCSEDAIVNAIKEVAASKQKTNSGAAAPATCHVVAFTAFVSLMALASFITF